MRRRGLRRAMDPVRFRWLLGLVFVGLAIPAAILIRHAFGQLELDSFRREQLVAEQVYARIDGDIAAAIGIEYSRDIDEYRFASAAGDPASGAVQRSALSVYPPDGALPGTIGYFEVDRAGALTTPLLPDPSTDPAELGLSAAERDMRYALEDRIASVLAENRLVRPRDAPEDARASAREEDGASADAVSPGRGRTQLSPAAPGAADQMRGQAAFDELTTAGPAASARLARPTADDAGLQERAVAVEQAAEPGADSVRSRAIVSTFEIDVEPFRFSRLDAGHFVLFRNVRRAGERYVQGVLLDSDEFFGAAIGEVFEQAALAPQTALTVSVDAQALTRFELPAGRVSAATPAGMPLYTARLTPPLAGIELSFAAGDLPRSAAHPVLVWTAVVLLTVLVGGFLVAYRFGVQQIELVRQQQGFVAAVSHELKTPLTSIRMYGEMLRSGWASEDKKEAYYEFIYAEGERLTRLINNVLQLARLSRGAPVVSVETMSVDDIVEMIRAKVATQLEQAGVTLTVEVDADARAASVQADADALSQVFINLVDNAIKFARDGRREIVLAAARAGGSVRFSLRDFGPGLPPGEMKRLFQLFYRPDNELTRTTSGTGIGLALVQQLVAAMNGSVDVRNRDPGAEFRIDLPRPAADAPG